MDPSVAPAPGVGVDVGVPGVGVGVSVGHTPGHASTVTDPPVAPPTGRGCASIEASTTPPRPRSEDPGTSACNVTRASVPGPLGGATDVPFVKQPYVTLPGKTIGALHCTDRPVLPRKVPGWASTSIAITGSNDSVNWKAARSELFATFTSNENGDVSKTVCSGGSIVRNAVLGVDVGVAAVIVGVSVGVGHVPAQGVGVRDGVGVGDGVLDGVLDGVGEGVTVEQTAAHGSILTVPSAVAGIRLCTHELCEPHGTTGATSTTLDRWNDPVPSWSGTNVTVPSTPAPSAGAIVLPKVTQL